MSATMYVGISNNPIYEKNYLKDKTIAYTYGVCYRFIHKIVLWKIRIYVSESKYMYFQIKSKSIFQIPFLPPIPYF